MCFPGYKGYTGGGQTRKYKVRWFKLELCSLETIVKVWEKYVCQDRVAGGQTESKPRWLPGPDRKLLNSRTASTSFLLHCFKQSRLLASTAAAAAHKLFALSTLPLGRSALHWDLQHSYDFWFVKKTSLLKLYLFN